MRQSTTPLRPREVTIGCGPDVAVQGLLALPSACEALVVFAHGSGSSRHSPRNAQVAGALHDAGLGTLLLDLLTGQEEPLDAATAQYRFDIPLLTARFEHACAWAASQDALQGLPIGCFGASTGSAVALRAAADLPQAVFAVVSRGGRPDLAGDLALERVRAPTLLLVGSLDREVLHLNTAAARHLVGCEHRLEIVRGATHLFEEPGTLDLVARLAVNWFLRHLPARGD